MIAKSDEGSETFKPFSVAEDITSVSEPILAANAPFTDRGDRTVSPGNVSVSIFRHPKSKSLASIAGLTRQAFIVAMGKSLHVFTMSVSGSHSYVVEMGAKYARNTVSIPPAGSVRGRLIGGLFTIFQNFPFRSFSPKKDTGTLLEFVSTIILFMLSPCRTKPPSRNCGEAETINPEENNVVSSSLPAPSRICSAAAAELARFTTSTSNVTDCAPYWNDGKVWNTTLYELS